MMCMLFKTCGELVMTDTLVTGIVMLGVTTVVDIPTIGNTLLNEGMILNDNTADTIIRYW